VPIVERIAKKTIAEQRALPVATELRLPGGI